MLARTLITRPNVERLVDMPELQLTANRPDDRQKAVTQLMEQIRLTGAPTGGNIYDISYRDSTPARAERLVGATLEMFVNAGSGSKKRDSKEAGRFIEGQIRAYEEKLVEAESRVKDFKMRNFGVSGVSDQDYFARVSALSQGVNKLRIELISAEQSRAAYQRELALEDPQLPADVATRGATPAPEIEVRLEAQRKQLDDLLRRYTEAHPDVIGSRRVVGELEAEARALRETQVQSGNSSKAGRAATSPVYQKLRISAAEAEAHVAALRSQLVAQRSELEQVRALAGRAPVVEAELAQLNRDYDVIRKNYDQMVARRESASLGVRLDESAQLAEFRVVEPPRVSPSPVFPARWHLALAAIVASLAAGIAAAVVADVLRPTFDEAMSLRQYSTRPLIGTVSLRVPPSAPGERPARRRGLALAVSLFLMVQVAWFAWIALKPNMG
jgi:polysaccharide chain length determinant protein (PEP-CTERM system associated)